MAQPAIDFKEFENQLKLIEVLVDKKANLHKLDGDDYLNESDHITILECLVGEYANRWPRARHELIEGAKDRIRRRSNGPSPFKNL